MSSSLLEIIHDRRLLRVLIYPWGLWLLSKWPAAIVSARLGASPRVRALAFAVHGATYVLIGFPATFVTTSELLITANEAVIGEQADYRLQSDFAGNATVALEVPGERTPENPAPPTADPEAYRRFLVERYAPVIIHKVSDRPEWDIPVFIDYDADENPRNNVIHEPQHRPHVAGVYGELTAETTDSYYLTYSLYHVKDYDHPVRELISSWAYHDSDNEGLHLRVDKATMRVVEADTWFHNRFMLCNDTGISHGTEPVHGKLQREGERVIIYAQSQGHGVRCAQSFDAEGLGSRVKVLRYRAGRPQTPVSADATVQYDATYELDDFDAWYRHALGPFGKHGEGEGMFEKSFTISKNLNGKRVRIGRFIAGLDYAKDSWSRPKPMWSWDDGWDELPIFVWHFFPAEAFQSHAGSAVSDVYIYNRPVEKTLGMTAAELEPHLSLKVKKRSTDKWNQFERNQALKLREDYWRAMRMKVKQYVNYLFHALG